MTIRKSHAKRHRKNKSKKKGPNLPYGPGYMGLAMTICSGDTNLANKMFGG